MKIVDEKPSVLIRESVATNERERVRGVLFAVVRRVGVGDANEIGSGLVEVKDERGSRPSSTATESIDERTSVAKEEIGAPFAKDSCVPCATRLAKGSCRNCQKDSSRVCAI